MRQTDKLLMLMQYCNSAVSNQNDYMVSSVIIRRIVNDEDLSIEQISEEACISQASVSRFIRKAGFDNWQDFRECCSGACREIGQRRYYTGTAHQPADNRQQVVDRKAANSDSTRHSADTGMIRSMSDTIFSNIIANLDATRNGMDYGALDEVISKISSAREVIFIGDEHALSIFYTLQLDLMFTGIPAYLYKNIDVQSEMATRVKKGSAVIYLNIENNFINPKNAQAICKMREAGAYVIVFSQQDCKDLVDYDFVYNYGLPGSANDGYYSLFFLSQLLSNALIARSFSGHGQS